jgi:hypothetical protein
LRKPTATKLQRHGQREERNHQQNKQEPTEAALVITEDSRHSNLPATEQTWTSFRSWQGTFLVLISLLVTSDSSSVFFNVCIFRFRVISAFIKNTTQELARKRWLKSRETKKRK